MRLINLFKYQGFDGCIVSPLELPMEHTPMLRLIADEGKELFNGEQTASVIDVEVEEAENWDERIMVAEEEEEEEEIEPVPEQ